MPDSEYTDALIDEAESFLSGRIRDTPVESSPALSSRLGVPVGLKLECLQITGSFKLRGASFAVHKLGGSAAAGVCTCSAGNHGLGLAWAARALGVPATVYVPSSIDTAKRVGLEALGARVMATPHAGFDQSEEWTFDRVRSDGTPYVSAYDDLNVMAGNGGTIGREVVRQVPDVATIVVPVGGGGMAAGLSVPFKAGRPVARLVAAQLKASPALARSLEAGKAITRMPPAETLAGGLEGGLGTIPFRYLRSHVDQVVMVDEEAVWAAFRWMLTEHQILVEPSAAVAVAACLADEIRVAGPTVVVLTGRNVSLAAIRRMLA